MLYNCNLKAVWFHAMKTVEVFLKCCSGKKGII